MIVKKDLYNSEQQIMSTGEGMAIASSEHTHKTENN